MNGNMIRKSHIVAVLGAEGAQGVPAAGEADMIELRMDLVNEPIQAIRAVRLATTKPIIATNRLKAEGGMFQGSERERIELLLQAAPFADFVDIELLAELRDEFMARVNKPVIVSYHDFNGMPDAEEMMTILEKMKKTGAICAKIAVTPQSLLDNLRILGLLLDVDIDMPLSMIAMGNIGRHLRAVAPLYGSILTYGFVAKSTAPGQMSLAELSLARKLLDRCAD
jgi:3-dehydroquinate dehydratase-1